MQVIARAAAILRRLATAPQGRSLAELAAEVGLPRSTVHRLIKALESEGLVAPVSASGGFRLGPGLLQIASANREWLNVNHSRLYAADIDRLKATYVFDQRSIARVVAQRSHVDRTTTLYASAVTPRDGDLSLSLLYGYRVNWLTTFYIGYGDYRLLDENDRFLPMQRSVFAKASYAFQR